MVSRLGALLAAAALSAATVALTVAAPTASAVPAGSTTSPVKHIIQIQLENENATASFPGTGTTLDTLAKNNVFLPNYYATGHASLDNYIAQVSGQTQYPFTSGDCEGMYRDNTGTVDAHGFYQPTAVGGTVNQASDPGCVYPKTVKTLADQLTAAGKTWGGFMEDLGATPTREVTPCGQPAVAGVAVNPTVGGGDQTNLASASDQYAARHNPFLYFHSLIDEPTSSATGQSPCELHVASTAGLVTALNSSSAPSFSFVSPNLCDDGHDSPCQGPGADNATKGAGGLTSANAYLAKLIPQIQATSAYADGGLIVISFDEAASSDTSACCGENGPGVATTGGGGRTGAVLLGSMLTPHTSTCTYNHFSFLRTYEDLFGLTPAATGIAGSDGLGHLAHAGDAGTTPFVSELTAAADPCTAAASTGLPEVAAPAILIAVGLLAMTAIVLVRRRRA